MNTQNTNQRPDLRSGSRSSQSSFRSVIITLIATAAIVFIGVWLFYGNSNSFDTGERNAEQSGITINIPRIVTEELFLYIDTERFRINPDQEAFSQDIDAGEHEIIVNAPNHWPWNKHVTVEENATLTLSPFLVRKNLESDVFRFDREPEVYQALNADLKKENAQTTATSNDGSVTLTFTGSTVKATWNEEGEAPEFFCESEEAQTPCPRTKTVFEGQPILDADFYGNRNDVFAFGVPAGIYVTEISNRKPKSLQPVYEGRLGAMAIIDGNAYLQDQEATGVIIEIPLFMPNPPASETATSSDETPQTDE